ncbi:MAG: phosphatase PAP2 family protein [Xanthomonadaceae bacterium]|nr:phosphatase PAP2 family protein [Xanthomonadaceae bacterium]
MLDRLARSISILGHPLLTLPSAMAWLSLMRDTGPIWPTLLGLALIAAAVVAFSWRQVRRARWTHIDASEPSERAGLNRALTWLLVAVTAIALLRGQRELALGAALAAMMVLTARASSRWCKLSLHVAFAVFAAGLLWTWSPTAMLVGLAFAATVAWSRVALRRHTPRDLVVGAAAGALSAVVYVATIAQWASSGSALA